MSDEFRSSRRTEDDYTASELEDRWGRFDDVDDPTVRSMLALAPAPCWDCGSTDHRDCSVPLTRRELDAIRLNERNRSQW